jgi:integrase/recombinase XerD
MKHVTVNAFFHRNCESIGFSFEKDELLEKTISCFPEAKWSRTRNCWYMPLNKDSFKEAYRRLSMYAIIDFSQLKNYLEKKREILAIKVLECVDASKEVAINNRNFSSFSISETNLTALQSMIKILHLKAYSPKTIYLYRTEVLALMRLLGPVSIDVLSVAQIQSYLLWLLQKKGHSESKVHTTINALKFYYEQVLKRQKMFFEIPRPKKPLHLPTFCYKACSGSWPYTIDGAQQIIELVVWIGAHQLSYIVANGKQFFT